jgi:hypothetical protein
MQSPGEVSVGSRRTELSLVEAAETGATRLDPVTGDVLMQVMTELANMMSLLARAPARRRIGEIQTLARILLHQVAKLIMTREINPWIRLRMSPDDAPLPPSPSIVRVGVFPLSANPIHWGHLLSGLSVMARARLDKIIYVIGRDSSPDAQLYPEELRRGAAAEAIALFQPLFTLVPASAGKTLSGPASFFRLLALNGPQAMEAFYIFGYESDRPVSMKDSIETPGNEGGRNAMGHNERMHSVSIVRIDAEPEERSSPENPRLLAIPSPLPCASSAAVRAALLSSLHRDELAVLPACAFRHFRMLSAFD